MWFLGVRLCRKAIIHTKCKHFSLHTDCLIALQFTSHALRHLAVLRVAS